MRFTTLSRLFAMLAVIALLVPAVVLAQSNTQGAIAGTIVDASNAVLPNITVTLKSLDKGFSTTATTNGQGGFAFPLVDAGTYSVTVSAAGFKQFAEKVVVRPVNDRECQAGSGHPGDDG